MKHYSHIKSSILFLIDPSMASMTMSSSLRQASVASYTIQALATQRLPGLLRPLDHPKAFQPRKLPQLLLPFAYTAFSNLSSFLSELWDCVLRAVPKKKTPYGKKRSRQLAGKALKDVTHLNHCSGCGRIKRMHILCPHCVSSMLDSGSP